MSRRVSPSTAKPYGIERVTRLWGVSRATVYRHRRPDRGERRRPGPVGAMPDTARPWSGRSGSSWRPAPATARAIASCGRSPRTPTNKKVRAPSD
jgi:hypothetical protein